MNKIKSITPQQEEKFKEFMVEWRDRASGKTDHAACQKAAASIYRRIGIKRSPLFLHFTSPLLAIYAAAILGGQLRGQLYGQLDGQLRGQLGEQLREQLRGQLGEQLREQLDGQLRGQLYEQLRGQLDGQLDEQLDGQLRGQLRGQLYEQLDEQLDGQLRGHYQVIWWEVWACYYEFAKFIGVSFNEHKYNLFNNFVGNIHTCLPYRKAFIYSDKPLRCHWKGNVLHNDTGMSVEYADGWGLYSLNGIPMKPEYVLTPASDLTPETVLKEKSVDVRRELLRKIGVMRMLSRGRIKEESGDYKLVDMSPVFAGIRYAPHLLMKNPSLNDTWHLEGVHPQCETVQQAINWRAGNIKVDWTPAQLS